MSNSVILHLYTFNTIIFFEKGKFIYKNSYAFNKNYYVKTEVMGFENSALFTGINQIFK